MHNCLEQICKEFETIEDFLRHQNETNNQKVNALFMQFMECFKDLGVEKLEYPNEFITDVRLYHEKFAPLLEKFQDIEIRYLMLSDFYDFARLTKRYKPNKEKI
jgi:hypothetical protein